MSGLSRLSQAFSGFWRAVTGRGAVRQRPTHPLPGVILHDPAAERPHDLDDPFFDAEIQARMAEKIASAAQKKT